MPRLSASLAYLATFQTPDSRIERTMTQTVYEEAGRTMQTAWLCQQSGPISPKVLSITLIKINNF